MKTTKKTRHSYNEEMFKIFREENIKHEIEVVPSYYDEQTGDYSTKKNENNFLVSWNAILIDDEDQPLEVEVTAMNIYINTENRKEIIIDDHLLFCLRFLRFQFEMQIEKEENL